MKLMKDHYSRLEALILAKSFVPVSAPISSAPVLVSSTPFFYPTSATSAGSSAPLLPLESNVEELAILSAEDVSSVLADVTVPQVSSVGPVFSMLSSMITNSVSAVELNSVFASLPVISRSQDVFNPSAPTSVGLLSVTSRSKVRNTICCWLC